MISQSELPTSAAEEDSTRGADRLYQEGLIAGLLGAATIAIWFLILDTLRGRPLQTPTILGTAIFGGGLASPTTPPVSLEMVTLYTWVHGLVFCVIGGVASRLLAIAERQPNVGFGVMLLFVVFEFGFLLVTMIFAESVFQALSWWAILVGNLLAAVAMGAYLWRRHPNLTIRP